MKKQILFFTGQPPKNKTAIHIWLGKTDLPHQQLLCQQIGAYLGTAPTELAITPTGKLYLPDSPLHFNLSDAGPWLATAFHWGKPIGIDIEQIRPLEGMDQLILDCFSKREQEYVKEDRVIRFWQIWNRKEACLKALGLGLQDNMGDWDCSGDDWISVNQVWVRSVPMKHNLSAAVAISN